MHVYTARGHHHQQVGGKQVSRIEGRLKSKMRQRAGNHDTMTPYDIGGAGEAITF